MKNRILSIFLTATLLVAIPASAFSPYENLIRSGQPRQVGLLAQIQPGQAEALKAAMQAISTPREQEQLAKVGITNLAGFTRTIGEATWLVLHFTQCGKQDYLSAATQFESASEQSAALTALVDPHPQADRYGTRWLQMEWINYIRGKDVGGPATSNLMIVTTIKPEKEMEYRSLHQTVWPGVVDQVARSNNRDLCIFLAGIDGLLVEFLYREYVGDQPEKDEAMSQSDAINHRWWKLTDACQQGLPGVDGNWVLMDPVK